MSSSISARECSATARPWCSRQPWLGNRRERHAPRSRRSSSWHASLRECACRRGIGQSRRRSGNGWSWRPRSSARQRLGGNSRWHEARRQYEGNHGNSGFVWQRSSRFWHDCENLLHCWKAALATWATGVAPRLGALLRLYTFNETYIPGYKKNVFFAFSPSLVIPWYRSQQERRQMNMTSPTPTPQPHYPDPLYQALLPGLSTLSAGARS